MVTTPLQVVDDVVARVGDPSDPVQRARALGAVSPALIDDVVFGTAAAERGGAADGVLLAIGTPASPGIGVGRVIVDPSIALDVYAADHDIILYVDETTPADEPAMRISSAIVTRRGGPASHAAIIARTYGIPAVCGVGDLDARNGDQWVVDGSTGEIRALDADADAAAWAAEPIDELPASVATLLEWADAAVAEAGGLRVLANADTPEAVGRAFDFGAAGIGLCRTEHQFTGPATALVAALPGPDPDPEAVERFVDHQRRSIAEICRAVGARPLLVRLLDAPAHEFIGPSEHNPMLGLRGIRVGILHPEVFRAQLRGIAHGFADAVVELGADGAPHLTVGVAMASFPEEVAVTRAALDETFAEVSLQRGLRLEVACCAFIETPRAALCSAMFAPHVDSLSFGTNDLTQLTYGLSRDDTAPVIAEYLRRGWIERDPFESLDPLGVARLLALGAQMARSAKPSVGLSLCGAHAADPASMALAAQLGIDAVSVPPVQVPATRLAAAHLVLGDSKPGGRVG